MNVVDSSGWLEYVAGDHNAGFFAPALANTKELIVPSISLYEVFIRVHQQHGESAALKLIAHMLQGQVVNLDSPLALRAARVSLEYGLPMADSIILATAIMFEATLWTQDEHFKMITGVRYVEKHKAR
jgi:toxin FitB